MNEYTIIVEFIFFFNFLELNLRNSVKYLLFQNILVIFCYILFGIFFYYFTIYIINSLCV